MIDGSMSMLQEHAEEIKDDAKVHAERCLRSESGDERTSRIMSHQLLDMPQCKSQRCGNVLNLASEKPNLRRTFGPTYIISFRHLKQRSAR